MTARKWGDGDERHAAICRTRRTEHKVDPRGWRGFLFQRLHGSESISISKGLAVVKDDVA